MVKQLNARCLAQLSMYPLSKSRILETALTGGCATTVSRSHVTGVATVDRWTIVAQSKGASSQVVAHTSKSPNTPRVLAMMNGLPYLSKLVSGYPLSDLKQWVQEQVQKSSLTMHPVQEVQIAEQTPIGTNYPDRTPTSFRARWQLRSLRSLTAIILSPTRIIDPDCLAQPRLLPLGLRQQEVQTKDVSSEGLLRLGTTS